MVVPAWIQRRVTYAGLFVLVLLLVEFIDEFVFGMREAAWPLIRNDLHLSYEQIGILLSIPPFLASMIEPLLGILGDVWKRRILVIGGGVIFTVALVFMAISGNFVIFLLATILINPASGSFVALSQSTLMDTDPNRHEINMARWVFAGSLGVVVGSVALGVFQDWRGLFIVAAILSSFVVMLLTRFPFGAGSDSDEENLWTGIRGAWQALRRREVLRWLTLLQCADLMGDVLLGFLALYFVDVVGVDQHKAAFAVGIWTAVSLLGDLLLIPLLEHVKGLVYLRVSVIITAILFPVFLLVPGWLPKLIALVLLGLSNTGWYSILQGQLYTAMPGQSGTVLTLNNLFGLAGSLIPLVIGMVAEQFDLSVAMWLLMIGPIVIIVSLPALKDR